MPNAQSTKKNDTRNNLYENLNTKTFIQVESSESE